jgi:long-chain acyl-CoA synthetase
LAGSIGTPIADAEIRVAPDGEIIVRGPHVCLGYLARGGTTPAADGDGWFHTGDIGAVAEDGSIRIIDRVENAVDGGEFGQLRPGPIERTLKTSPYIDEAVVFVGRDGLVSALIEPDLDTVPEWADSNGVLYASAEDLRSLPAVRALIDGEARRYNDQLRKEGLQPVEFVEISAAPLGAEQLTATRKVRHRYREQLAVPLPQPSSKRETG